MTGKRASDYRELLRAGRWFRGVSPALQEALLGMASLRRVVAREVLFARGDAPNGLFGVIEGKLRVSGADDDGKEALLTIIEPPGWVGEVGLVDGLPRSHDLIATAPSRVVHIPPAPLLALLDAEPRYWRDFAALVTVKLRLAFIAIEDGALSSVRQRVARRLVMLADGYGEWTDRTYPLVEVSQGTLATMVSASRQTVNRVLQELEAEGLVQHVYGGVEIKDLPALRRAVRGSPLSIS